MATCGVRAVANALLKGALNLFMEKELDLVLSESKWTRYLKLIKRAIWPKDTTE